MKLIDACEIIVDCPHSTAKDEGCGIPLVRTPNIGKGRLDLNGVHRVSETVYNQRNERAVPQFEDLILAREAPVGNVAMITKGQKVCLGQRVVLIRPNKAIASPAYLTYYLLSDKVQHRLKNNANGAVVAHLNMNEIRNLEITLPPLDEQNRIASILTSIDDKIDLNNRINHNLEEQAQALYKSWFVDFEPFKGDKFVDSELGMIPEGWYVAPLDSLCSIISRGFSPKYDEESNDFVLGQRCVRNNLIDISIARRHIPKNLGERELKKWDILINSTGFGSLGRVAQIYFTPNRLTFDSHLTLVRSKEEFSKQYIGRNLLSRQDEIENLAVGSTGQTELPRERVKALPIIVPTHDIMSSFGEKIKVLNELIQRNIEANVILQKERDELLPRLMSGNCQLANNAI